MKAKRLAFVLRFQEACCRTESAGCAAGTKTITAVRAEENDSDPGREHFGVLPPRSVVAGTLTVTNIRAEAGDTDSDLGRCSVVPRDAGPSMGTETHTKILAESADADRTKPSLHAIPRVCSSF